MFVCLCVAAARLESLPQSQTPGSAFLSINMSLWLDSKLFSLDPFFLTFALVTQILSVFISGSHPITTNTSAQHHQRHHFAPAVE